MKIRKKAGGPPKDLRIVMARDGYLPVNQVARLLGRDKRTILAAKPRTKRDARGWFVFVRMEDVAKAIGPDVCRLHGLTAANEWGCAA